PRARETLIVHYSPLVKYVASRVATGLPANVEQADLVSYGIFGLIDALEKFDPSREIKFETYAIPRIRVAIIDELRSLDWVPRSVRFKAREVERAHSELEARLKRRLPDPHQGRRPSPEQPPGSGFQQARLGTKMFFRKCDPSHSRGRRLSLASSR